MRNQDVDDDVDVSLITVCDVVTTWQYQCGLTRSKYNLEVRKSRLNVVRSSREEETAKAATLNHFHSSFVSSTAL